MLTEEMKELYEGYYEQEVEQKRTLSARDSFHEIKKVTRGQTYEHLLDVGTGDGAVIQEIDDSSFVKKISAVEISNSGIQATEKRNLKKLVDIKAFDGYEIPYPDNSFDIAMAIYVLEHVEHERMFLREIARVANELVISIPLEHTFRIRRARMAGKAIGHVNYYTLETFRNILETSGLEVVNLHPYTTSREYEVFVSGKKGIVKQLIRSTLLSISPRLACNSLTYHAIAHCKKK